MVRHIHPPTHLSHNPEQEVSQSDFQFLHQVKSNTFKRKSLEWKKQSLYATRYQKDYCSCFKTISDSKAT